MLSSCKVWGNIHFHLSLNPPALKRPEQDIGARAADVPGCVPLEGSRHLSRKKVGGAGLDTLPLDTVCLSHPRELEATALGGVSLDTLEGLKLWLSTSKTGCVECGFPQCQH